MPCHAVCCSWFRPEDSWKRRVNVKFFTLFHCYNTEVVIRTLRHATIVAEEWENSPLPVKRTYYSTVNYLVGEKFGKSLNEFILTHLRFKSCSISNKYRSSIWQYFLLINRGKVFSVSVAPTDSSMLPQNSRQGFEISILTYRKKRWFSETEIWAQVAPIWRKRLKSAIFWDVTQHAMVDPYRFLELPVLWIWNW